MQGNNANTHPALCLLDQIIVKNNWTFRGYDGIVLCYKEVQHYATYKNKAETDIKNQKKRPYHRECSRRCGRFVMYGRRTAMRTLLEEFWYGNVNPQEQSTEGNREIKNLLNLIGKNRDNLSETLTEAQ